jgi:hypothetical protein
MSDEAGVMDVERVPTFTVVPLGPGTDWEQSEYLALFSSVLPWGCWTVRRM